MKDSFQINNLDQLRLLSDPFKLKLIQAFSESEQTARQVAEQLGENVTRLYRHVDALYEAGLLEITRETQKRGTVERTFRTVARAFEVDRDLFGGSADNHDAVRDLLRAGEQELMHALSQDHAEEDDPVFIRLRLKGTPKQVRQLRQLLLDWLADAQDVDSEEPDTELCEAGVMIAFYPIDDRSESR